MAERLTSHRVSRYEHASRSARRRSIRRSLGASTFVQLRIYRRSVGRGHPLRPLVLAPAASPRTAAGFARRLGCGAAYEDALTLLPSRSTTEPARRDAPSARTVRRARERAERSSACPCQVRRGTASELGLTACAVNDLRPGGVGCPLRRRSASDQETRDRAERGSVVRGSARASVVAVRTPGADPRDRLAAKRQSASSPFSRDAHEDADG